MQTEPIQRVMRTFGRAEDLDLEFSATDRPSLVTGLLARCVGDDADHWWAQPVGTRIAELLRLYMFDEREDRIELSARCMREHCGETFGFELPLRELSAWAPRVESWEISLSADRHFTVRRPIGLDLLRWRSAWPLTWEQAIRMMLDDLVLHGQPEAHEVAAIADAIAEYDPLVALTVAAECPACGNAQDVAVDIEGLVLTHFANRQQALLHDVHRLASKYGWTEQEVLSVPPQRRVIYLALLDAEAS